LLGAAEGPNGCSIVSYAGEGPMKKRGRKPLPASQRKHPQAFRLREGLHAKLKKAALSSVRTISEEIEYRLVQSFKRQRQ